MNITAQSRIEMIDRCDDPDCPGSEIPAGGVRTMISIQDFIGHVPTPVSDEYVLDPQYPTLYGFIRMCRTGNIVGICVSFPTSNTYVGEYDEEYRTYLAQELFFPRWYKWAHVEEPNIATWVQDACPHGIEIVEGSECPSP